MIITKLLTKYAKMNEFIILINEAVELIVLSGKGSVCRLRINGRKSRTIFLFIIISIHYIYLPNQQYMGLLSGFVHEINYI